MYANVYFASFSLVIFPVSVLLLWMVSPRIFCTFAMHNCMHFIHPTDEWLLLVVK